MYNLFYFFVFAIINLWKIAWIVYLTYNIEKRCLQLGTLAIV